VLETEAILAIAGMLAGGIVFASSPWLAAHMNNPGLQPLLALYALYICLFLAGEHFMHVLISQDRYRLAVGFEAGETIVRLGILLLPLALGLGLTGLVVATVVYAFLRVSLRTTWVLHTERKAWTGWINRKSALAQLGYSIPLGLSSCVGLINSLFDRALVAVFFTPVDYAVYTVGALEIPLDVIFQASVANVLRATFPALIRDGKIAELIRIWRESVRKLAMIVLPSFAFLLIYSHEFITLLFTDRYAESVHIFRIYLFLMPLHMFVLSLIPQAYGKTRINLYVVAGSAAANLGLSFVLLKTIGFYGPAVAAVVVAYATSATYLIVGARLIGVNVFHLLSIGTLMRIVASAATAGWVSSLLRDVTASTFVNLGIAGVLFAVVFLAVAALLHVFTAQDRQLIVRWIAKFVPGLAR